MGFLIISIQLKTTTNVGCRWYPGIDAQMVNGELFIKKYILNKLGTWLVEHALSIYGLQKMWPTINEYMSPDEDGFIKHGQPHGLELYDIKENYSLRELRDASYHRWSHGSSISSISSPGPTTPKSPYSQARPHVRRPTLSEDDQDFGDTGAYGHDVLHIGFEPPSDIPRFTKPRDIRAYRHAVPHTGFDPFDTPGPKSPHNQARPHARLPTRENFGDGHDVPHSGFDPFDTLSDSDDDDHGLPTDAPSDLDDGYDSDLSEALSGSDTDHDADLDVATPSDSEEELAVSLRNPRPHSLGVLTISLKHTSHDPDRGRAKDRPDGLLSLHAALDTDVNDAAPDSGEDDAERH
ncbi:hypothetical protein QQZ08_003783 [Neonectria magnoliae]|uniref:Uncharacterized protein n=1 Tax=Neonectria magnoliae TaxID=2732573 RepID=A0ABR1IA22_9HYPO